MFLRDAKTLFPLYTVMALVFACLFFMNSHRAKAATALSQPLDQVKIIDGRVLEVRKEEYIAVIFPVIKQFVDFEFTHDRSLLRNQP